MEEKRSSFTIFKSVVNALFLREIQTRFGSKKMGYFWAIIDPMIQVLVFTSIHGALMGSVNIGYDYAVFLASGLLGYNLFKGILNKSISAFSANAALFTYKQVRPIDSIISRIIVEWLQMTVVTLVFIFIGWYFEFDMSIKNFNAVFIAFSWLSIMAIGLGLLFAVIASFYENFEKLLTLILTPLFFLSGIFYTLESLPQVAREILLYNPIAHFMEMIHGNFFYVLDDKYVNYTYMLYWTVVPLFLGLFFYKKYEQKIIST